MEKSLDQDIDITLGGLAVHLEYFPAVSHKNHNILLILGHFGTTSNYSALIGSLTRYGNVTVADLPGFNDHASLYSIGSKPLIDELAEYLATIISYRFRSSKVTVVGIGYGVAIITRLLQRHPQLAKKVDLILSIDGFAHHDDFNTLNAAERKTYALQLKVASWRLPALFFRKTRVADRLVERVYAIHLRPSGESSKQRLMDWHKHDFRTYCRTLSDMLTLDNCSKDVKVLFIQYWSGTMNCLDKDVTDQHLQIIYDDFRQLTSSQKISSRRDPIKAMYRIVLSRQLATILSSTAKISSH